MADKPTKIEREGNISISTFAHPNGDSYNIQKGYKKKDSEEWTNVSMSLYGRELSVLKKLLSKFDAEIEAADAAEAKRVKK